MAHLLQILRSLGAAIAVVVTAVALSGCGENSAERAAAGTYVLDNDAFVEAMTASFLEQSPGADTAALAAYAASAPPLEMQITLNEDGTAQIRSSFGTVDETGTGTWTLTGTTISIVPDPSDDEQEPPATAILDGDRLRLTIPDTGMPELVLVKRED
ncbi:MAG: hypothetical protein AAGI30_07930 [Planctomycetota bacterium]